MDLCRALFDAAVSADAVKRGFTADDLYALPGIAEAFPARARLGRAPADEGAPAVTRYLVYVRAAAEVPGDDEARGHGLALRAAAEHLTRVAEMKLAGSASRLVPMDPPLAEFEVTSGHPGRAAEAEEAPNAEGQTESNQT